MHFQSWESSNAGLRDAVMKGLLDAVDEVVTCLRQRDATREAQTQALRNGKLTSAIGEAATLAKLELDAATAALAQVRAIQLDMERDSRPAAPVALVREGT